MALIKTADLPVGLDDAYALITQPERLRRWQTVTAYVDLRVGGDYRWTVIPGHRAAGTFREIEPGKRVVFGWGWEGEELAPDTSTLAITLEPTDGGTRVTLRHEGLNPEQEASHSEGWDHFMERLATVATTGDAGLDEWACSAESYDALSAAEASLAILQPVLRALTVEDQIKQTPCAEFDCHGLAQHLFGSLTTLGQMAGATVTVPAEGSLEDKVSTMAMEVIRAWLDYREDVSVGGALPTPVAKAIVALELLLHGWDFAQASGQTLQASDNLVVYMTELLLPVIEGGRANGSFLPAVEPPADASALDRLAAFAGRTRMDLVSA